jgi:putative flippase GtrA
MRRLIKFAIVGGVGFPVNLGLCYLFKQVMGIHYAVALFLAFIISMTINYIWNHYWTFRDSKEQNVSLFKGWCKYTIISLPLDGTSYIIAITLKETLLNDYYYGYLMATALGIAIVVLIKYTAVKRIVWGKNVRVH